MDVNRKRIQSKVYVSGCFFFTMILSFTLLIQNRPPQLNGLFLIIILLNALACILLLIFLIQQYRAFRSSELIIENQILHVPVARSVGKNQWGLDFYFSSFGMLLGDVVVPFDVDNKKLKSFHFEGEAAVITYGHEDQHKSLRIICNTMTTQQKEAFQKRLYFETGIKAEAKY